MKGYAAASTPPVKRRWKGLAVAVLALVLFSLLVPLAFLLGLQNRFPSGNLSDERLSSESGFGNYARVDAGGEQNESKRNLMGRSISSGAGLTRDGCETRKDVNYLRVDDKFADSFILGFALELEPTAI